MYNTALPSGKWWTPPAESLGAPKRSFDGGRFKVIQGTRGLVVCADGGVLRCHRVPDIGDAPLASLCLKHNQRSEECGCHCHTFMNQDAVIGMASYPAPPPRLVAGVDVHAHAPNLMVTTKGGALKLIRVEDAAEEDDSVFLLVGFNTTV